MFKNLCLTALASLAISPASAGYAEFIADEGNSSSGNEALLFVIIPLCLIIYGMTGAAFKKGKLLGIASIPVSCALIWFAWTYWIQAAIIGFLLCVGFGILCMVDSYQKDRDRDRF